MSAVCISKFDIRARWSRQDLISLVERLELYLGSGISLDKALSIMAQGGHGSNITRIEKVRKDILAGQRLSLSLAQNMRIPPSLASIIKQGERSGGLVAALSMSRKLMEQQDEVSKKILSALAYPLVIGAFAGLLTIGLVRGVMPQIIPMLKGLNIPLPFLTRAIIAVSENAISYGMHAMWSFIVISSLTSFFYKKVLVFRGVVQACVAKVPILGVLMFRYSLSLFLRSFGALVDSGVPVVFAYNETASGVAFLPLAHLINNSSELISQGVPIGTVMAQASKRIPIYVSQLLLAGEASGTLGASAIRAADIIDRDMDHSLKRLTGFVEPAMMAGMGCVVGAIALSIMMPIYDISRVLQR